MPDGPALELQVALVAALKASSRIAALVESRVYDEPPDGAALPYIRLGGIEPLPQRTTGTNGVRVMFSIEAHSRPTAGRVEATLIVETVKDLFDGNTAALSLGGHRVAALDWMTQTVGRDSDGQTYLGITAFRALIEPDGS